MLSKIKACVQMLTNACQCSKNAAQQVKYTLICALMLAAVTALISCTLAQPLPQGTVLSRLLPGQPGAVSAQARPLTRAERKRYDAIDQHVMQEQDAVVTVTEPVPSLYYYSAPVFYSGYNSGYYSYYGYDSWSGWPRWGWSMYYGPAWWW